MGIHFGRDFEKIWPSLFQISSKMNSQLSCKVILEEISKRFGRQISSKSLQILKTHGCGSVFRHDFGKDWENWEFILEEIWPNLFKISPKISSQLSQTLPKLSRKSLQKLDTLTISSKIVSKNTSTTMTEVFKISCKMNSQLCQNQARNLLDFSIFGQTFLSLLVAKHFRNLSQNDFPTLPNSSKIEPQNSPKVRFLYFS